MLLGVKHFLGPYFSEVLWGKLNEIRALYQRVLDLDQIPTIAHFPKKVILKIVIFLIPKPPLAIGAHTLSQPTKFDLDTPSIPTQRMRSLSFFFYC